MSFAVKIQENFLHEIIGFCLVSQNLCAKASYGSCVLSEKFCEGLPIASLQAQDQGVVEGNLRLDGALPISRRLACIR